MALGRAKRDRVLAELRDGFAADALLSALEWHVELRRGRFYVESRDDACLARITPLAGGVLLLEIEGRASWREVSRSRSPGVLVACMATDPGGLFHGLGELHETLGDLGSARREMVCADDDPSAWYFLDEPPSRGQASVPEVLYHAFGVPVPVLAQPEEWYARKRSPAIVEHDDNGVLVEFTARSWSGDTFGGRCLYERRPGGWGAFVVKPNQSGSLGSARAWLERRRWVGW